MASSMASMTIMRSMDFSRATASAICKSSNLFAETAIRSVLLSLVGVCAVGIDGFDVLVGGVVVGLVVLALFRLVEQSVGHHQLGVGQKGERQGMDRLGPERRIGQPDGESVLVRPHDLAAKPFAPLDHVGKLDLGFVPGPGD